MTPTQGMPSASSSYTTRGSTTDTAEPPLESKAGRSRLDAKGHSGEAGRPLSSMSARLPAPADERFSHLVHAVEALGRETRALQLPPGTPPGAAAESARALLGDTVPALVHAARLRSTADARALLGVMVPAFEANFDPQPVPGMREGFTMRGIAANRLLAATLVARPIDRSAMAYAVLAHAQEPQEWVEVLMIQNNSTTSEDPYPAMLDRIVSMARARGLGAAWQVQALAGLARAHRMTFEIVEHLATHPAHTAIRGPMSGLTQVQLDAGHVQACCDLRQQACQRARQLAPQALAALVRELTAQVEMRMPSTAKALEGQAAAAVRDVLLDAGIEAAAVAAAVEGMEQGVGASRATGEQAALRAAIRRGMAQAVEQFYGELSRGLLPPGSPDPGNAAVLVGMLGASQSTLLDKVSVLSAQARTRKAQEAKGEGAVQDTKHGPAVAGGEKSSASDKRLADLGARVEALARKVQAQALPNDTAPGPGANLAMMTHLYEINQGFTALFRELRIDSDKDACAVARALATAIDASFDGRPAAGTVGQRLRLGNSLRAGAITAMLRELEAARPGSLGRWADVILTHTRDPAPWTRGLLGMGIRPDMWPEGAQRDALVERVLRVARARDASPAWVTQALTGIVETQRRSLETAEHLLRLEMLPDANPPASAQDQAAATGHLTRARERFTQAFNGLIGLRQTFCERALDMEPQVLANMIANVTEHAEWIAPSSNGGMLAQAYDMVGEILAATAGDATRLVAAVQGLDRGVAAGREEDRQRALRAAIRSGMAQAVGRYCEGNRAAQVTLLKAVSAQAPT